MNAATLINQTSGITDYWTPPFIKEAARACLGRIDLDPASSHESNAQVIKARKIFTEPVRETVEHWNGLPVYRTNAMSTLERKWSGVVWMNHPFGKKFVTCKDMTCKKDTCINRGFHLADDIPGNYEWVKRLHVGFIRGEIKKALCITYACTSEEWFGVLAPYPQCFLRPRTNYYRPDGKPLPGVTKGSVVTYFGDDADRFAACFEQHGEIKVQFKRSKKAA